MQDLDNVTGLRQRRESLCSSLCNIGQASFQLPGRFIEEISAFTGDPPTILTSYLLSPEALPHMVGSGARSRRSAENRRNLQKSAEAVEHVEQHMDNTHGTHNGKMLGTHYCQFGSR